MATAPCGKNIPCEELGPRCEPCNNVAGRSTACSTLVSISYRGLIATPLELRKLIGAVGDDPFDPAGFIDDLQLQTILDRHRASLREIAQRKLDEQCISIGKMIDEALSALSEAMANRESEQRNNFRTLKSDLDAALAAQNYQREAKSQELESLVEGATKAFAVEIETMVERFTQEGLPSEATEYFDEVKIPMAPSPRHDGISYGVIDEPYITAGFGRFQQVTAKDSTGNRRNYAHNSQLFESVETAFYPIYGAVAEGRYLYLSNNGLNVKEATVILTTEERLREFAKTIAPSSIELRMSEHRKNLYAKNPVTEVDSSVGAAKMKLNEYTSYPVTQHDGAVDKFVTLIEELCVDPQIITGDALVADMILSTNEAIVADARREVELSGVKSNQTQSQPDEK